MLFRYIFFFFFFTMTIEKLNDLKGYSLKGNLTLASSCLLLKIITLKGFHSVQVFLPIPPNLPLLYTIFLFFWSCRELLNARRLLLLQLHPKEVCKWAATVSKSSFWNRFVGFGFFFPPHNGGKNQKGMAGLVAMCRCILITSLISLAHWRTILAVSATSRRPELRASAQHSLDLSLQHAGCLR